MINATVSSDLAWAISPREIKYPIKQAKVFFIKDDFNLIDCASRLNAYHSPAAGVIHA
jgi:hypothetical protein